MARYEIRFLPSVRKDLRGLPKPDVHRVLAIVDSLSSDLRPRGCSKVSGREVYRIRSGRYRIVYEVRDAEVVVVVVKVGHRKDVYRGL